MLIKISEQTFDPWQELANFQQASAQGFGANSIFIGAMRDFNLGDKITGMYLEHYPGMTEKCLGDIVNAAAQQWAIMDSVVIHRIGEVLPEQPIVLVAVWSTHRGDAFDACRYIIEQLKSTAPFWKKESLVNNQSRWVAENSHGYLQSMAV